MLDIIINILKGCTALVSLFGAALFGVLLVGFEGEHDCTTISIMCVTAFLALLAASLAVYS